MSRGRALSSLRAMWLEPSGHLKSAAVQQALARRGDKPRSLGFNSLWHSDFTRLPSPSNHVASHGLAHNSSLEPVNQDANLVVEERGSNTEFCNESQREVQNIKQLGDNQVPSPRHDLAIIYTCTVCDTRSAKMISRSTYETGVVIVRCPSCKNLHLVADHKGWFGEPGTVEDFLAEKGIEVKKGSEDTYQFSIQDLAGWTPRSKA